MQGHTHALSGALLWLAAAPVVTALSGPMSHGELAAGAVACAGAALLPDCDHPQGTIAHSVGPLSQMVCRVVEVVSGGHRHATHSFFFAGLAWAFAFIAGAHGNVGLLAGTFFVLAALALRALSSNSKPRSQHGGGRRGGASPLSWGASATAAAALTFWASHDLQTPWPWIAPAVVLGVIAHLIGDCLTPGGCPLFWPVKQRFAFPIVTHTGDVLEWGLSGVMFLVTVVLARNTFASGVHIPFFS